MKSWQTLSVAGSFWNHSRTHQKAKTSSGHIVTYQLFPECKQKAITYVYSQTASFNKFGFFPPFPYQKSLKTHKENKK